MKIYETPEIEIVQVGLWDVITASPDYIPDEDETGGDPL